MKKFINATQGYFYITSVKYCLIGADLERKHVELLKNGIQKKPSENDSYMIETFGVASTIQKLKVTQVASDKLIILRLPYMTCWLKNTNRLKHYSHAARRA